MSHETQGSSPVLSFECRDASGAEIFPADALGAIADYPEILDSMHKDPDLAREIVLSELAFATHHLTGSYNLAMAIRNPRKGHWVGGQQRVQNFLPANMHWLTAQEHARAGVTHETTEFWRHRLNQFIGVKSAIDDLLKPERTFYAWRLKKTGQVTEEDFRMIGAGEARIGGFFRRLRRSSKLDDSPEVFEQVQGAVETCRHAMLLENHCRAASILNSCVVFGDRNIVKEAAGLMKKLQDISCDQTTDVAQKLALQQRIFSNITQLASRIDYNQADPPHNRSFVQQLENVQVTWHDNAERAALMTIIMQGREYRLAQAKPTGILGDEVALEVKSLDEDASEPQILSDTVVRLELPVEEKSEPEHRSAFEAELEELAREITFPQPAMLSGKEIRNRSLDEARAALIKGECDEESSLVIAGRTSQEAAALISRIEFFESFMRAGESIDPARMRLSDAVHSSAEAAKKLDAILQNASETLSPAEFEELASNAPSIQAIKETMDEVRADWGTVMYIVRKYWPNGPKTAKKLKQLLYAKTYAQ